MIMKRPIALLLGTVLALTLGACTTTPAPPATATPTANATTPSSTEAAEAPSAAGTPITITAGDTTITAVLNDSQVSKDFAATLPATLPWFRNAGIEYITELPAPLTETGPFYTEVQAGDLVYYNPLDSITIIYAPTSSVPTLTKMGEITSDLSAFDDLPENVDMRIELSK